MRLVLKCQRRFAEKEQSRKKGSVTQTSVAPFWSSCPLSEDWSNLPEPVLKKIWWLKLREWVGKTRGVRNQEGGGVKIIYLLTNLDPPQDLTWSHCDNQCPENIL